MAPDAGGSFEDTNLVTIPAEHIERINKREPARDDLKPGWLFNLAEGIVAAMSMSVSFYAALKYTPAIIELKESSLKFAPLRVLNIAPFVTAGLVSLIPVVAMEYFFDRRNKTPPPDRQPEVVPNAAVSHIATEDTSPLMPIVPYPAMRAEGLTRDVA